MVFTTGGMAGVANDVKRAHPKLRVVLFSGAAGDLDCPGVILVQNGEDLSVDKIRKAVFG